MVTNSPSKNTRDAAWVTLEKIGGKPLGEKKLIGRRRYRKVFGGLQGEEKKGVRGGNPPNSPKRKS